MHTLDWLWWKWAAQAHHTVAQFWVWEGSHSQACRLLVSCLKPRGDQALPSHSSPTGRVLQEPLQWAVGILKVLTQEKPWGAQWGPVLPSSYNQDGHHRPGHGRTISIFSPPPP